MKKIFAIIIDCERLKFYSKNLNFYLKKYREIIPPNVEIYIIDITKLHLFTSKVIKINLSEKGFNYFCPKSFKELKAFASDNYIVATIKIKESLLNIRLNILLNKICQKKIIINNMGYFVINNNISNFSLYEKINFILNVRFSYFLYRFFSIINLTKKTDLMITSSKSNVQNFDKGISFFLKKKFGIDISYIKKFEIVNSYFDSLLATKDLSDEYIVFCDSGFDHNDRILRDGEIKQKDRELYYENLNHFLIFLKEKFQKKVIFCLHPTSNYPPSNNFEKIKKNFECLKFQTEDYIKKSFLVIFLSSLTLNIAILLKKNIILIESDFLGNFYKLRNQTLNEEIDLMQVNIDNKKYEFLSKEEIINKLDNYKKNYGKFIDGNIISHKNENYKDQIQKILNNEYFNK